MLIWNPGYLLFGFHLSTIYKANMAFWTHKGNLVCVTSCGGLSTIFGLRKTTEPNWTPIQVKTLQLHIYNNLPLGIFCSNRKFRCFHIVCSRQPFSQSHSEIVMLFQVLLGSFGVSVKTFWINSTGHKSFGCFLSISFFRETSSWYLKSSLGVFSFQLFVLLSLAHLIFSSRPNSLALYKYSAYIS